MPGLPGTKNPQCVLVKWLCRVSVHPREHEDVYGKDQNQGEHVVLGVAVRADFSAERQSQNQGKSTRFLCQVREDISAERHTPTLFPFLITRSLARQNW